LLRDIRNALRSPDSETPQAGSTVDIALYRLPERQREILRRYDLEGESQAAITRDLAISPRQFYRDRRAGLAALSAHLFNEGEAREEIFGSADHTAAHPVTVRDAEMVGRTLARSLWQSGNADGLRVLRELTAHVREPAASADLLLELAEVAAEFDDRRLAAEAARTAEPVAAESGIPPARRDYLLGKLARVRASLTSEASATASHYRAAETSLRRSLGADPTRIEAQSALAHTLGDLAIVHFVLGALAEARAASLEARRVIERFDLAPSAKNVETLAFDAILQAFRTGRAAEAQAEVAALLLRSIESGWCSTATRLAGYAVGLSCVSGDYADAIGWYERMSSIPFGGTRPRERPVLTFEAAHAYTMSGMPQKALSILKDVEPDETLASSESPSWHASVAAALERCGYDVPALAQAHRALAGHTAQRGTRGVAEAHRLIAICNAKLGNVDVAREHILEAQRLSEAHATPYALLRTLVAKADILRSPKIRSEAIELARLLRTLGKRPPTTGATGARTARP